MKKLILTATVLVASITSCKKEEQTNCYECTVKSVYTYQGVQSPPDIKVYQHCDVTKEDIEEIEKNGTGEDVVNMSGVSIKVRTLTTCKIKN